MKLSYKLRIIVMLLVTGLTTAVAASAQVIQEQGDPTLAAPVEPLRSGVTEEHVFAEMASHNELRSASLLDYTAFRTYQVVDPKGKLLRRMAFDADNGKVLNVDPNSSLK